MDSVIVGIGINTGNVPDEIKETATSIKEVTGLRGVRNQLISEVLNEFEPLYLDYIENGNKQEILNYYSSRLFITGHRVLVPDIAPHYTATVLGISETGALIVRDDNGIENLITTGEIKLI